MAPGDSHQGTPEPCPAVEDRRSFSVRIVDRHGLWQGTESGLPSFDGRVTWQTTAWADAEQYVQPDLSITVARDLAHLSDNGLPRAAVSVLVDTNVPIGLRHCGPIVACQRGELQDVISTLAQAVFRVALADQVVSYDWVEIEEFLRPDCLLVVRSLPAASAEAFAAAAINAACHFQGSSRIEPDGLLLGIAAPSVIPLVQRRNFTRPLQTLAGYHCHFLAGVHTHRGLPPEAALLLSFPIPRMPGEHVRPGRARRR